MGVIIICAFLAVPCALAFWVWRSLRDMGGKEKPQKKSWMQRMAEEQAKMLPQQKARPRVERREREPRTQTPSKPPSAQAEGDVVAFRVGVRYYGLNSGRVIECLAIKGKTKRFAAFATMNKANEVRELLSAFADTGWGYNKIIIDSGVETCQRGNIRADRLATEAEIAADISAVAKYEKRIAAIFGK